MSASAGRVMPLPKGVYDSETTYYILDIVRFGSGSFICKKTSLGNEPSFDGDTEYWMLIANSGAVSGVKGNAEQTYREGNVNIDYDDLGIDSAISSLSDLPVKNSVIAAALALKQDSLTFDNTPAEGSNNPVTSDGIAAALDALEELIPTETGGSRITVTTSDTSLYGENVTLTDGTTSMIEAFSESGVAVFKGVMMVGGLIMSVSSGGSVKSDTISIPYFGNYTHEFQPHDIYNLTVTLYSAAADTITYTDDAGSKTVVTDNTGKAENVKILKSVAVGASASITFTSSIAKDPSNLSNAYSKTITLTQNMNEISVMPIDRSRMIYWYGYKISATTTIVNSPAYTSDGEALSFNTNNATIILPTVNNHETGSAFNQSISLTGNEKGHVILNNNYYESTFSALSFSPGYVSICPWTDNNVKKVAIAVSKLLQTLQSSGNQYDSNYITGNASTSEFSQNPTLSALWFE